MYYINKKGPIGSLYIVCLPCRLTRLDNLVDKGSCYQVSLTSNFSGYSSRRGGVRFRPNSSLMTVRSTATERSRLKTPKSDIDDDFRRTPLCRFTGV